MRPAGEWGVPGDAGAPTEREAQDETTDRIGRDPGVRRRAAGAVGGRGGWGLRDWGRDERVLPDRPVRTQRAERRGSRWLRPRALASGRGLSRALPLRR